MNTTSNSCHVLRCIAPAVWRLTIDDDGREQMSGVYCGEHAAQHVRLARPGRRITLDAVESLAVAR